MSDSLPALSLLGTPASAVRATQRILGAGTVEDDHRCLPALLRAPDRRVVFVLREPRHAVTAPECQDPRAALATWNDAVETVFDLAGSPWALERLFVLHYEWLIAGQRDYLGALLAFARLEPSDARARRLEETVEAEHRGRARPSESVRALLQAHASKTLARATAGFAAGCRLRWTRGKTSVPVAKLAKLERSAIDLLLAEKDRRLAIRDWRIDRLLIHRRRARRRGHGFADAAAKVEETLEQAKSLGRALSTTEDRKQLGVLLASARSQIDHTTAGERRYAWQRDLPDALERVGACFRLPGGEGEPFVPLGGRLVSESGEHAFEVRDNAVRARPEDVKLVRSLAPRPEPASGPSASVALDVGTKSGDGFLYFMDQYAALLGNVAGRIDTVVGIDLNEIKLAGAVDLGILPVLADGGALPFADDSFDLVVAMELLEHVPEPVALSICREIRRVARGPIFIQNPDFSLEPYLAELGLKFSWMGWKEHCHHITRESMTAILAEAGFGGSVTVEQVKPVLDASHPLIVPLDAPPETTKYTKKLGPKPAVTFDQPVFEKLRVTIR